MKVSLLTVSTVLPSIPTKRHIMHLSPFDHLHRIVPYMQRTLFYAIDLESHEDYTRIIDMLKLSLADTLPWFYPLAGRLSDGKLGPPHVDCNDEGVEFIEASADDICFQDAVHEAKLWPDLAGMKKVRIVDVPELPLLSVQVTRFGCEGISLGIAFNHVIMDGNSFWHFVKSWTEISTGSCNISLHPIHSRSIQMSSEHSPNTPSLSNIHQPPSAVYKYSLPYEQYLDVVFTIAPQTKVQQKHFYFSFSTLDKLKQQICTESNEKSLKVTSLKVICAYVWKALLKARKANRTSETGFYTIVDMRKRINPPLEEGYFGNVITVVGAVTKTGHLLKNGLSYAVKLLEESVNLATEADVKGVMENFENQGNVILVPSNLEMQHWFGTLSSPNFAVYETEFGWGKPVAVRPGIVGYKGVLTFFRCEAGIDVFVSCTDKELAALGDGVHTPTLEV